ncbi:glycosyltransferase family A protein [Streptococcus sp. CSL10205-OR2]|uniref:glycosyltransferase family A protein n=1 Tax=Streptococcus sp. CSL10205-OR2 TaxID=2980558 RepID=UPI0021D7DC2C|nr:glycosyltransferase family A protein [Streptococcus sp. CSL10205-OR2]MCU9533747.1 glycosyltransferase family 2 protein [Streptococcus sp. CSL10205-OR2]
MKNKLKATVFIPVFNGENNHLKETLVALYKQKTDFPWDVIITDSESQDSSLSIIKEFLSKYDNLRLIKIKKSEFSHGRTRQMVAEISEAQYIVYLTQDAIPINSNWLSEMISPFSLNEKIVAVLGKQKPRDNCFPAMKYDINLVFEEQGVPDAITLWTRDNKEFFGKYTKESFYSDVCSAAPRDFLLNNIGYRTVDYSEDYEYGKDILDAGYIKAYNSRAVVEHSNDVKLSDYKKRIFDENYNIRLNSGNTTKISFLNVIINTIKFSFKDSIKILKDTDYTLRKKIYWSFINPLFHFEKWRGIRLANSIDLNSNISKYSLEKREK